MYYKQLDGLRAFAVIAVIIHHWINPSFQYAHWFHYGAHGVDLFFVLSGFLITNILIHQREKEQFQLIDGLKKFYIRRTIRIFPIYYLVMLFMLIFVPTAIKEQLPWLLTYQYNNHIFFFDWQLPAYIHHLWTLSIEEQFYLIWPFVVFLLPPRKSFYAICTIIFASIITCALLYRLNPQLPYSQFTLSSFSGLAIGGLLALLRHKQIVIHNRKFLLIFSFLLFVYLSSPYLHFTGKSFLKVLVPLPAILSFLIISKGIEGYKGFIGRVLENNFLVFVGKISYGLYLYHMFIPYNTTHFIGNYHLSVGTIAMINVAFLLIVSVVSWFLIEKPLNNLKAKFNY